MLRKGGVTLPAASLAWALAAATSPADAGRWALVLTEPDGLTVERREHAEAALPELRVVARSAAGPEQLLAAAWELRDDEVPHLGRRAVLSEGPGRRLVDFLVRPPFIRPRHCLIDERRWVEPASGTAHLRFRAVRAPRPSEGALPFAHLEGAWRFEPEPRGGSRVVYTTLVDLGGVPALLARGPQQEATVATVRALIARAEAPLAPR